MQAKTESGFLSSDAERLKMHSFVDATAIIVVSISFIHDQRPVICVDSIEPISSYRSLNFVLRQ